jgi:hypothetical protein
MHSTFRQYKSRFRALLRPALGVLTLLAGVLLAAALCSASEPGASAIPSIFEPRSTPADSIRHLSYFVLSITGLIFLVVFVLLTYVIVKFGRKSGDSGSEPAQGYGSTQIELAWTVIPVLIVVILFAATARVIHAIRDAPKLTTALEVTVIGHQFWWEFRYPALSIVTANELHIPASDPAHRMACSGALYIGDAFGSVARRRAGVVFGSWVSLLVAGNSTLAKRFNGAAMAHPSISFSRHLAVRLPRRISRVL